MLLEDARSWLMKCWQQRQELTFYDMLRESSSVLAVFLNSVMEVQCTPEEEKQKEKGKEATKEKEGSKEHSCQILVETVCIEGSLTKKTLTALGVSVPNAPPKTQQVWANDVAQKLLQNILAKALCKCVERPEKLLTLAAMQVLSCQVAKLPKTPS